MDVCLRRAMAAAADATQACRNWDCVSLSICLSVYDCITWWHFITARTGIAKLKHSKKNVENKQIVRERERGRTEMKAKQRKGRKKCQVVAVDMSAWLKSWWWEAAQQQDTPRKRLVTTRTHTHTWSCIHWARSGHVACHKNNANGSNKSHFVSTALYIMYQYHYWNLLM